MRRSNRELRLSHLEDGSFTATSPNGLFQSSPEHKKSPKPGQVAALALLHLLALTGLAAFCLSASALACRLLDMPRRQDLGQPRAPTAEAEAAAAATFLSGPAANVTSTCRVNFRPLSYLWGATLPVMLILNSIGALVMLQSLMLLPRVSPEETHASGRAAGFNLAEQEPCPLHQNDIIVKFTYKTRCRDDVIMRTQLPVAPVPLPAAMKKTMAYSLIETQIKKHQLHEAAFGRAGIDPLERLQFASRTEPRGGVGGGGGPLQQIELDPPEGLEANSAAAAATTATPTTIEHDSRWSGTDWIKRVNEKAGEQK